MKVPKKLGLLCLETFILAAALGVGQAQSAAYLNFADLTSELRTLVNGSSSASMRSIGESAGGKEIWLVEVANTAGTSPDQRPALLLVGTLEGNHLLGSQLILETLRHLLTSGDADLDNQSFYLIPRLNPDGAESMFAQVQYERTRNDTPFDDDNDGRIDEDPAEDLNGDGLITLMRVPDPSGAYLVDPENSQLMKRADRAKGESGAYKIYWEGRDSDGDGYINEDGQGGVDLNRNFQHVYPYWQRDAGAHMVSESESRALLDFVISHRNIGAIITYGHSDNLVTPPDARGTLAEAKSSELSGFADTANDEIFSEGVVQAGRGGGRRGGFGGGGGPRLRGAQPGRDNNPESGRRPAESVHRQDIPYFAAVSEAYKEITGIKTIGYNRKAEGAFFQYGYFQFGVPSFSTQGWAIPSEPAEASEAPEASDGQGRGGRPAAGRRGGRGGGGGAGGGGSSAGAGLDVSLLKALEAAEIDGFVNWSSFDHPDLGRVEIGGFKPYVATNPPAADLPDLGRKQGEFALKVASMLPRVKIAGSEVTAHGGGVFTVKVTVENTGFFPTSLQHGVVARAVDPTTVQIQIPAESILTGDEKSSTVSALDGSNSRAEFSWVIQADAGSTVEIRVRSQKGGSDSTTVTLR